jgi:hypothetical protein
MATRAMNHADAERELKKRKWRYDVGDECFYDGAKIVGWQKLIALVPGAGSMNWPALRTPWSRAK